MKKKNVKYIGSAVAVALLAAGSPVIINNLAPTTIVQANADPIVNPTLTPTQMLTAFKSQFDDRYVASTSSLTTALTTLSKYETRYLYFDENSPKHIFDIQNDQALKALKDKDHLKPDNYFQSTDGLQNYYYRDILGYVTITGAGKTDPEESATGPDIANIAANITSGKVKMPITVTIHLVPSTSSWDGVGTVYKTSSLDGVDPSLTTFSFSIYSSQIDITKDTKATAVATGTSMADTSLQSGNNSLDVTDNYSNKDSDAANMGRTPIYGKSLFTTADAAMKYAQSSTFDPTSTTSGDASDALNSDDQITKPGTYYQTVSYKLDNGKDAAITHMLAGDTDDLTNATVKPYDTYINGSTTPGVDGTDYALNRNKGVGTITIVRPISVTGTISSSLNKPTVAVGSKSDIADNTNLSDVSQDKLIDDFGNTVSTSKIEPGETYYTNPGATNEATDAVVDGKFAKAGTYYRRITFTLASGNAGNVKYSSDKVDSTDTTVTFSQQVVVQNGVTTNIADSSATVGEAVKDTTSDVSGDTLTNINGSLIDKTKGDNNGVSFGTAYYSDNGDSTYSKDILDGTATATSGVVDSDGNFAKTGDYLRTITFYLVNGTIDTNSFETSGQPYSTHTDTDNETVTYIQKVHIDPLSGVTEKHDTPTVTAGTTSDDTALTDVKGDSIVLGSGDDAINLIDTSKGEYSGIDFGTQYYTNTDLKTITDLNTPGTVFRTITYHLTRDPDTINFNGTGATKNPDNSVTFVQAVKINPIVKVGADVKVTDLNIKFGDSGTQNGTDGDSVTSAGENAISDAGITFGSNYYETAPLAYTDDPSTAEEAVSPTINKFTKPGTYYRTITFNLKKLSDAYEFTPTINGVGYKTGENTITYVQRVIVAPATNTATFGNHDLTVDNGTATTADILTNTAAYTLSDDSSKDSIESSASLDGLYYSTKENAEAGTNALTATDLANGLTNSQYYRVITVKVNTGDGYAYNYPGASSVDYEHDTIKYIQTINVNEKTATIGVSDLGVKSGLVVNNIPTVNTQVLNADDLKIDNITFGTKYYDNPTDAINGTGDTTSHIVIAGNNYVVAADAGSSFYRLVTIKLADGTSDTAIISGLTGTEGVDYKIDGDTITYAQKITITSNADVITTIKSKDFVVGDKAIDSETLGKAGIKVNKTVFAVVASQVAVVKYGSYYYINSDKTKGSLAKDVVQNGVFVEPGNYYREVTIPLLDGLSRAYNFDTADVHNQYVGVNTTDNTVTYLQEVDVTPAVATSNITGAIASVGDDVNKLTDNGTTDITTDTTLDDGTIQTISVIDSTKTTYGDQYFAKPTDALNNTDGTSGQFTTAGPYYRRVTLTLANGELSSYTLNGTEGTDYIDNGDGTVTYAQLVTVGIGEVSPTLNGDVEVVSGDDITKEQSSETNTIIGANGTPIVDNVTFGDYYLASDADETTALADILSGNSKPTTDPVNGTVYGKVGTYYRKVILHFAKGNTLDSYKINGATDAQINKADNTITYIQKVTITPNVNKVNNEALDFENEFGDHDNSDDVIAAFDNISKSTDDYFDSTKSTAISTLQKDTNIAALMTNKADIDTADLDAAGVTVSFSAVDNSGKTYANAAEITAALKNNGNLPLTITGKLTSVSGVELKQDSFSFKVNALSYAVSLDNREGTVGNAEITDSKDTIVATDTKETSSVFGNATPAIGKYYNSVTAALAGGTDGLATDAVKDGKYETAGNYYQAETFTLPDGSTPASAYTYTINGKTAVLNTDYVISTDGKTITFVRKVDVSLNSEAINDDAKNFESQFKTTTNNDDVIKAFENIAASSDDYFAAGKATATSILQNDENIKTLLGSSLTDVDTAELDSAGVTVTFTATDNNGKTYASAAEIATALKANPNLPLTINGNLSSSKVALDDTDLTLTVNALDYNATINNESTFTLGDTAPSTSTDILNSTVTNAAEFGKPTLSKTYYGSVADALNGKNPVNAVDANGKLIKPGDLYQTETFTISDSSDVTANAYGYQLNGVAAKAFDGTTGDYIISDGGKTITFARKITVNANDSAVVSEAKDFADQFGDLNNTNDVISAFKNLDAKYLDATNPVSIADVQADTNLQKLLKQTTGSLADLIYANGKVTFKVSSNGKELTTPADIVAALENTSDMPVTITGQITTDDQNAKLDNNGQFSFNVSPLTYTAAVPDISGKTNNPVATSTDGYKVTASTTGVSEVLDNPTFGKYYSDDKGTKGAEDDGVVDDTNYIKAGDYYQEVMFHVEGDIPATAYVFTKDGKTLTLGTDYTVSGDVVTFLRKVHIDTSSIATPSLTTEKTVNAGSKVSDDQRDETNDIKNDNNDSIVDHVEFGKVYTDESGKDVTTDAVDGDTYKTPRTYYREVILTLKDGALDTNTITGLKDVGATQVGNTVTFMQKITVSANAATVNTDKVTSTVGSPVSSLPAVNGNYTLNQAGTPITKVTASTDGIVYKNYDSKTKQLSDPVTSFDSIGTYYRVISFKTDDAAQYSFADANVISNKDGVITYVQPISVGQESDVKVSQVVTDTKNVKVNVSDNDGTLSSKDGYSLTDANEKTLIDAPTDADGISFSPEYYTLSDNNVLTPVSSADAHGYTISKKGIYYRKVIFKISAATYANYDFSGIKGTVGGNATDGYTVSFIQKVDASTNPATVTLNSPSVSYNTSADAASLKDPTSVTLKDDADKDINSGTPELSGIFSTSDAAKNATSDTGDVTGNLKAGTYYQRVTFPLADNDDNAYDFGDGVVAKDGKSVTYIRTITVKPSTGGGSTGGNTGNNTGNGSGDEDEWTYYKDPGVVTTKTTQPSYTLNNRANDTVKNRALAEDTSWITDQYRTNRAGVKQYHVATNEWIDANDVYFRENENNNNTDDDWTYYKDPGVVTTKEDQPAYALNNRANGTVKNRELAENTSWITDQYRTNKEGVKQYRVATGEWIDSHDVIFTGQAVNEDDGWTYYKDAGVVVTKPDQQYYSLNNKANDTVKNRALLEQTSWLTDQYRTNKEGVKQYRVATNEWIDSHDVIFVKNIDRIVNVDETNTYYSLYTIYGKAIKNRALEEKTSWRADKIAYDGDGNVYYRVATNEWVHQVDGVYLDTNAWYK